MAGATKKPAKTAKKVVVAVPKKAEKKVAPVVKKTVKVAVKPAVKAPVAKAPATKVRDQVEDNESAFSSAAKEFKTRIDSLKAVSPLSMYVVDKLGKDAADHVDSLIKKGSIKRVTKNGKVDGYKCSPKDAKAIEELLRLEIASRLIPRSFIVSAVSEFDNLFACLIRLTLNTRSEIWNSCNEALSYADAMKFSNTEGLKESLTQRVVEDVMRSSHSDQFKWLEGKLHMPLTKDVEEWPAFIELTERRNLYIHCDGRVTEQYLKCCKEGGVPSVNDLSVGAPLEVTDPYFRSSCESLLSLGSKLVQVLWRKLIPADVETAEVELNSLIYHLVDEKRYATASRLGEFGLTEMMKKSCSEDDVRMILVNTAQAYKWDKKEDKCVGLVDSLDWSASGNEYKLAAAVLKNDFKHAAKLMASIGSGRDIQPSEEEYRTWPLFKGFRKSRDFKSAFRSVFKKAYAESDMQEMLATGVVVQDSASRSARKSPRQSKTAIKSKTGTQ